MGKILKIQIRRTSRRDCERTKKY